jgi:DNA-binding CsgD family transcriptional regulator/N-acetylneuraminic acid mutarotase
MAEESLGEISVRECEILQRVATGATNQQIAVELDISINTVKAHLRNIFTKIGAESRTEAAMWAVQQRLLDISPDEPADESLVAAPSTSPSDLPTPNRMAWPVLPAQRVTLALVLTLVLAIVVWPIPQARTVAAPSGRMVDLPANSSQEAVPEGAPRWRSRAQMPTPRGRFAQAVVDDTLYVISGLTEEGWTDRVETYDPTADLWGRRAPKPIPVANVGAAVVDGRIYVPGGLDETETVRDVLEVYDPVRDEWFKAASLLTPLCAYAIAPYGDGFYLFGGWDGTDYVSTVYYYDAATDAWRRITSMETARAFAAAVTLNGRIYLLGGYDGTVEHTTCESYDPELAEAGSDPWQSCAPMNAGRAGHAATVFGDQIYVVGGGWERPLAFNELYDPVGDAWFTFNSPILGEWRSLGLSTVEVPEGGFLYAVGGWNGRYLGVVEAYQTFFRLFVP